MIEVQDLSKSYGDRQAISSLSFKVEKGEALGLLGPNGAGKTTTMKIITGVLGATSGKVLISGYDTMLNPIECKSKIGYLPEHPPLYPDMTVAEYLKFVSELKNIQYNQRPDRINITLSNLYLKDVKDRCIANLSKGFRQRVGIAQAILANPEILILDEPTVGLDPKQVSEIRQLINELKSDHTIVLSTHILNEVQSSCHSVVIINEGQIVKQGKIADLIAIKSGQKQMTLELLKNTKPAEVKRLSELIKKIDAVDSINIIENSMSIKYFGDEAVQAHLVTLAIKENFAVVQVYNDSVNLEDVFLNVIEEENHE